MNDDEWEEDVPYDGPNHFEDPALADAWQALSGAIDGLRSRNRLETAVEAAVSRAGMRIDDRGRINPSFPEDHQQTDPSGSQ